MPTSWSRNVARIAMQHRSSPPITRGPSSTTRPVIPPTATRYCGAKDMLTVDGRRGVSDLPQGHQIRLGDAACRLLALA